MGFVAFAALVLAVFSLVYVALSVVVTLIWRKRSPRLAALRPLPPVSVLKPLCGLEPGLLENLRSFCEQSHTNYEILFGARDANDPALEVARRVAAEYPHVDIRVIPGATRIGENRKCNTLAHLKMFAKYDMIVINDSDIRVGPHYLQRVVEPLTDPSVGIVSCVRFLLTLQLWEETPGTKYVEAQWVWQSCLTRGYEFADELDDYFAYGWRGPSGFPDSYNFVFPARLRFGLTLQRMTYH